jgi:mannose/cellobiose epimerase-like protein (N-acyl-D-glucosamine 2-epimerase family)
MAVEMKEHLNQKLIPFWKGLRDETYGGFYGYMDYDLRIDRESVKGVILNSRILWFFSNAYLTLKQEDLLHYAEHAYRFLRDYCMDHDNGGVFWSMTYDGLPEDTTKHTYNQAFAIYALSTYYNASKDSKALMYAYELFQLIETRCKEATGYGEAYDVGFQPVSNEKLSENGVIASRTMNTLLHVFEAYTELYKVDHDEKVGKRLEEILDIFADKVYNPEKKRQEVFFDENWNSLIDLHSYGHDIETSWLIDRGCEVLKNDAYTARMGQITELLAEEVYKKAYRDHSLLNECENGIDQTDRIWWVQAEAVIGFINEWQKQPEKSQYYAAAEDIWNYIKTKMTDHRPGSEWFWKLDSKGDPVEGAPIVEPWKCPYHNGRMCMELIARFQG